MLSNEILADHKASTLATENNLFCLGRLSSFRAGSNACTG